MALPTFNYEPSFSLDFTSSPRIERSVLGDGFVDHTPVGFRTNLRRWGLQFRVLRLSEIQPIIDFLDARGAYRSFKWTPPHPNRTPGIWICPSYSVNRPDGVTYNLSCTFQEQ